MWGIRIVHELKALVDLVAEDPEVERPRQLHDLLLLRTAQHGPRGVVREVHHQQLRFSGDYRASQVRYI